MASHAKGGCLYDTGLDLPDTSAPTRGGAGVAYWRGWQISTQARCSVLCILLYHSMGFGVLMCTKRRQRETIETYIPMYLYFDWTTVSSYTSSGCGSANRVPVIHSMHGVWVRRALRQDRHVAFWSADMVGL